MADTTIEWCDSVWNVVRGCSRVSPGCGGANGNGGCYAERQAARFSGPGQPYEGLVRIGRQGPRWTGEVRLVAEKLAEPLGWKKPRRIFVNSMSDLFHEGLTNEQIASVFGVMAAASQHTFQVLTKRAKRMREWFDWVAGQGRMVPGIVGEKIPDGASGEACACVMMAGHEVIGDRRFIETCQFTPWPLPNVWIGVSAEDQEHLRERAAELVHVPAAVRFLSLEPLLGPIDFDIDHGATMNPWGHFTCPKCGGWGGCITGIDFNGHELGHSCRHCGGSGSAIDWVICGGESGHGARPFDLEWARSIIAQCRGSRVPVFCKQMGAKPYDSTLPPYTGEPFDGPASADPCLQLKLRDRKGGDPTEWPPGDWPREMPEPYVYFPKLDPRGPSCT